MAKKLGFPVYHLDKYLWKPGWERVPEQEFNQEHDALLDLKEWIIEGVAYFPALKRRLEVSDLIIYFKLDSSILKKRALIRMQEEKIRPNPFTNNCPYDETPENILAQNKGIDSFKTYEKNLDALIDTLLQKKKIIFVQKEIESKVLAEEIIGQLES